MFLDIVKFFQRDFVDIGKGMVMMLSNIYQRLFKKEFDAHDAYSDCQALSSILSSDQIHFNINNHQDLIRSVDGIETSLKIS